MKKLWIGIALCEGDYLGLNGSFKSKEEAVEYAEALGYVRANQEDFSDYGDFDYVSKDNPKYRLVFEQI